MFPRHGDSDESGQSESESETDNDRDYQPSMRSVRGKRSERSRARKAQKGSKRKSVSEAESVRDEVKELRQMLKDLRKREKGKVVDMQMVNSQICMTMSKVKDYRKGSILESFETVTAKHNSLFSITEVAEMTTQHSNMAKFQLVEILG
ncbi:hypothetical protein C7212DRAFT_342499 [Tuber magnatum]|uniref:Uncharacterized protein n=1 Tax=Tuber magnatum TaxID=42249 RepID=A0A317STL9_9PEZI|nr:hypothetical protein C7212DRAFT_342499 [Tuber magnatum]